MANQIVPLTSDPAQSFAISLVVDGAVLTVQLDVNFSEMAGYWVLTISDRTGNLLLDSIPMLAGAYPASNLLGQYAYLAIGSAYIINASGTSADSPNATNLGTDFLLLWSDTPTF